MKKTTRRAKTNRSGVQSSSGNVFADLGIADAEERHTKVHLAVAIQREILARGYSQVQAAELLSINQPKVSALLKFRLEGFSVERLMHFLTALGHDVEIVIKPRNPRRAGRILVEAA
jgi:predicted XRE-type DNA-binding protein